MKKILIFSLAYYPRYVGGAEVAIKEITERIPEKEISFDMVTARMDNSQKSFEKIGRINVYRVGLGLKTFDKFLFPIFGFFKSFNLNRNNRYNLSWVMMANQASVAASFFKMLNKNIPLVLTIQEGDEESHLKRYVLGNDFLYKILIKFWHVLVFKLADRATAISLHLKKRIEANNFSGLIEVIPNGVDYKAFSQDFSVEELEKLKKDLGFKKNDKIIITTSRLVEKNAVEDIILSLKHLPKSYYFLCLGIGPLLYKLQNLASREGLYERVKFIGFVETRDIPKYLNISNVFVRPSLSEGFGISFIEAMASGIPVITTAVGGIPDFLEDKKTGLFCEIKNPESIAKQIKLLEKDIELKNEIVKNARKMSKNKYDWDLISKEMQEKAFSSFVDKPKNILILTGIYPPDIGGPAMYAKNLRDTWVSQGHSVAVRVFGRFRRIPWGISHLVFLLHIIPSVFRADYVVTLDGFSAGVATLITKLFSKKIVFRTGGDALWELYIERTGDMVPLSDFYKTRLNKLNLKEKIIFNLMRWTLQNLSGIIWSTPWQRDIFMEPYNLKTQKHFIVENYYEQKKDALTPTKKNFLWGGRAISLKNISNLKKAFSLAKKENSSISLDVVFNLKHEDIIALIKKCYVFVLPSISDISPNIILSAISFNKPFIITKDTGLRDKLKDVGVFVNPLSVDDIKEKILFLSDDNNYSIQKSKIETFQFTHGYKDIAQEILLILEKI